MFLFSIIYFWAYFIVWFFNFKVTSPNKKLLFMCYYYIISDVFLTQCIHGKWCIIHVLGKPRCGLCCVKKTSLIGWSHWWVNPRPDLFQQWLLLVIYLCFYFWFRYFGTNTMHGNWQRNVVLPPNPHCPLTMSDLWSVYQWVAMPLGFQSALKSNIVY